MFFFVCWNFTESSPVLLSACWINGLIQAETNNTLFYLLIMQIYWILRDFCPSVEIPLTQNIDISKNLITEAQMCFNMREQTSVELLFSVWASVLIYELIYAIYVH